MADSSPSGAATIAGAVESDMKDAMRSGDTVRRDALRLLRAAIKNTEIERRGDAAGPLTDGDIRTVIQKQVKQRRDSIAQFRAGNRDDLAAKEEAELAIFVLYLPPVMDEAGMRTAAEAVIAETGAVGPKDMGKVMPALLARVGDGADRSALASLVRQLLSA